MKRFTGFIILCCAILSAGSGAALFGQSNRDLSAVVDGNVQFAIDLYGQINTGEGNLFFSPYSISTALAMTYGGARGETARQIADVLHFTVANDRLHPAFSTIRRRLEAIGKEGRIELDIANSMWPARGHPFLPEYTELLKKYYGVEITPVDYRGDPEGTRRRINSWIAGETRGKFKDVVPYGLLRRNPLTRLLLVNAIYFKGDWTTRFKARDTRETPFYTSRSSDVAVRMMQQTERFNYAEDENTQVLEMPYATGETSMTILLPKSMNGLQDLERSLSGELLHRYARSASSTLVKVFIPRFTMTYDVNLGKVLERMGMPEAFDKDHADFSGMDGNAVPPRIYLYSVLHRAFVKVNEKGTEAAAVTVASGCFPAGTKVVTAQGLKPIEETAPGTAVYSYDFARAAWAQAKVLRLRSFDYDGDMVTVHMGDESFEATGNQPIFVRNGVRLSERPLPAEVPSEGQPAASIGRWVEARALRVGDVLQDRGGSGAVVTAVSSNHRREKVYALEVERFHNCAVGRVGVLAHNKGSVASPRPVLFRADHPFIFLIRDTGTGSILFMGRVSNPKLR